VAVSNGTAALHLMVAAAGLGPGDEVIVPTLTFAASANCVLYVGATPVPADVDDATLLLDPADVERRLTSRTRAVIAVDFAGQPCDYEGLRRVAARRGLKLFADACHAAGASDAGRPVGSLADATAFSFHPVKPMTTGEGGMVTTEDASLARQVRILRSHGITTDWREREASGASTYEMTALGFNYRLTDLQCALGLSQLARLESDRQLREKIVAAYDDGLADNPMFRPLARRAGVIHSHHLYVVRVSSTRPGVTRADVFAAFRAEGIGVTVHYMPFHLHPYYRERFGMREGLCPVAERAAGDVLSLPCFAGMSDADAADVLAAADKITQAFAA